jgi:citronellyl-CoA synthetase
MSENATEKMPNDAQVITLPQFLWKLPVFCKGLPKRIQGAYMASRKAGDYPAGIGVCLEQSARRHPQGLAILFENRKYCYAELNAWSNRLAHAFKVQGLQKGDVVAVFIENRPELLVCIAAMAKIGAVAALINTSLRGGALRHSLSVVKPVAVICGEELFSELMEERSELPDEAQSVWYLPDQDSCRPDSDYRVPEGCLDLARLQLGCSPENLPETRLARPTEPSCYFYTSGTTGLPKAAVMTHGRFMKAYGGAGLACLQLTKNDRAYVTLPFYHGTALAVAWGSILAGDACLIMARKFSAREFWSDVRRYQATAFCYVGELCRYLLAQPETDSDRQHAIRLMFGNGLRPNLWKAFKHRFGIDQVMEFYGSSEGNIGFLNLFNHDCTVGCTSVPYAIVEYDIENDRPVRHRDGYMRRVSKGGVGLLLGEITEKTPFDGYTDPEKTEQKILRNVFRNGDAWFNSGDLMRDQGFKHVQFVDRLGDTFRWKGENVSTTEVENCISQFPGISDVIVYGVEIPDTNGKAGMAALWLQDQAAFDPDAFYRFVSQTLPTYAVPLFIRIVERAMETTATFKYKKTDLKKQGFDLLQVSDALWVCLPKSAGYQRLDSNLLESINGGAVPF